MTRIILAAPLLTLALTCAPPALALQTLLPAPYPTGVSGATPLDPLPQDIGGPQILLQDPYPQITGENSQGNPPIVTSRGYRRHRLVPSIYKRKYRVDRH
jgi:hypothetical protein